MKKKKKRLETYVQQGLLLGEATSSYMLSPGNKARVPHATPLLNQSGG